MKLKKVHLIAPKEGENIAQLRRADPPSLEEEGAIADAIVAARLAWAGGVRARAAKRRWCAAGMEVTLVRLAMPDAPPQDWLSVAAEVGKRASDELGERVRERLGYPLAGERGEGLIVDTYGGWLQRVCKRGHAGL